MAEAQKADDLRERQVQNLQSQKDSLPSFGGQFDAFFREAVKDIRSTAHEVAWGKPEGIGEAGAPMNPTPQLVTSSLGFNNQAKSDMPGGHEPNPSAPGGKGNGPDIGPANATDMGKDGGVHGNQAQQQAREGGVHGKPDEKAVEQNGGIHGQHQGQEPQQDPLAAQLAQLRQESEKLREPSPDRGPEQQRDHGMGH